MKKRIFILAILAVCVITALAGCSEKAPLTVGSFTEKAEDAGYTVIDATDQFEDGLVESYTIAINDGIYQIEFFIVPTETQAKQAFNENKDTFETLVGSSSAYTSVSAANYSRYSLTTGDMFYVISRIGNTLIYASVPEDNKYNQSEMAKRKEVKAGRLLRVHSRKPQK